MQITKSMRRYFFGSSTTHATAMNDRDAPYVPSLVRQSETARRFLAADRMM
ncbi:MAG: hypothetical protein OJF47_003760 [Nitrospira sp.]|nr:MAG: hypothetical protein OJF47_003760 [Nitrospira sp.]